MQRRRFLQLLRHHRGAASTLIALSMTALTGAAAISVDLGTIYLAKRELQGITDAAVLAAATGNITSTGQASAQSVITQSKVSSVSIGTLEAGKYTPDPNMAVGVRFAPVTSNPSAARLTLERQVPLFFGKAILGKPTLTVKATATAARVDLAAFSIGTKLATLSGGVVNNLLSSLAGTDLQLSVLDGQSLVSANMDILGFADALRIRAGQTNGSYIDLFNTRVPLHDVVNAMADAAPSASARDALAKAALHVGSDTIRLSDLINLGPLGDSVTNTSNTAIVVDAFSFLRSVLQRAQGDTYTSDLNLTVPGLASVKLKMVGGTGSAQTPWLTVTNSKDVVLRTAQTRLYLDVGLATAISGIATLRVPVFVELASAEARLSDIRCEGNSLTDGVTLAVTPSIGTAAIADINTAAMGDFSTPMATQPALLANVLGITKVRASANVSLGGVQPQSIHFTKADIDGHVTRTVATNDLVSGLAVSLLSHVQLTATALGITVTTGPLLSAVGAQLGILSPLLDGVLNDVSSMLGVKLGAADVRVDKMRCGVPVLVA